MDDDKQIDSACIAVIAAGGAGLRCQTDIPKQFIELNGRPILLRTIDVFALCPRISSIIVVVGADWVNYAEELFLSGKTNNNNCAVSFIAGGENRQKSVFCGLSSIPEDFTGVVVIHDAARPFVETQCIIDVIEAAQIYGAALSAVPVKDTVKVCSSNVAAKTLDRDTLFLAQTPQAFSFPHIIRAHKKAADDCFAAPDDCSLVERLGVFPRVIPGSDNNIKITTHHDITFAQFLLSEKI